MCSAPNVYMFVYILIITPIVPLSLVDVLLCATDLLQNPTLNNTVCADEHDLSPTSVNWHVESASSSSSPRNVK